MKEKIKQYAIGIAIPLLVGGFSAFLTRNNMDLYSDVKMPPFAPPSILFPIVWTILYILMGISSVLVYREPAVPVADKKMALYYYFASLIVNFLWNIVFFNNRAFFITFLMIILLFFLIIKTITEYYKINKTAAYLQIPYALWVAFAGILNFAVWYLNR